MSILQQFKILPRIFYLFGLAPPFCAKRLRNRKLKSCVYSTPVFISFLSSICVTALQLMSFYLDSFGLISKLLNYSFFGTVLLTNATANWQCLRHSSIYENIIRRIRSLEIECNLKFATKILYKTITLRYKISALLIIACFFISAAIVLAQAWLLASNPKNGILLACLTIFKEFMCTLGVLHFTLYVDIVRLFVAELNKQINCSPFCFYASTKVAFLKKVKLMHMNMFLLIKEINKFFGWQILCLVIHHFILILYSFYWFFLAIAKTGKSYSIAGMSQLLGWIFFGRVWFSLSVA